MTSTSPRPLPPQADLIALSQAALFNARDLLAAARHLSGGGSIPQAHALAVLALEEIGKSHLCVLMLLPSGQLTATEFWAAWCSHEAKLRWAQGFLQMMLHDPGPGVAALVERLASESRATHIRKLSGLYVDYRDGAVVTPAAVTAGEAAELIAAVQESLEFLLRAWGDDGAPERFAAMLRDQSEQLDDLIQQVNQAVTADPDAALAAGRRMMHELEAASAKSEDTSAS
jgi:AbiV family abortive infection protein